MASKLPDKPKLIASLTVGIVTAQSADGLRVQAYGVHSPSLDGADGYALQMPLSLLPAAVQEDMRNEDKAQSRSPARTVTFWIPAADVVAVEVTDWDYWQWELTVLPPKPLIPGK